MKIYKIYTLNHPITNEIRYVGQTCQTLSTRLQKHLVSKDNLHKINWLNSIITEGLKPNIVLIEDNLNKKECDIREKYYIKYFREIGIRLLNATDGGDGCSGFKHKEETKTIMSEIKKEQHEKFKKNLIPIKEKIKNEPINSNINIKLFSYNIIKQPTRKSILQYDLNGNFIKEFLSLRQIERDLGYFRSNISPCLKGIFEQAYGFIWIYA